MQKMTVRITENDIRDNERFRLNNPIVFVMQRLTGTLWQLDEEGLLAEAMKPFRACQLSREVMSICRRYRATGKMEPFEFDIEFHYEAVEEGASSSPKQAPILPRSHDEKPPGMNETRSKSMLERV